MIIATMISVKEANLLKRKVKLRKYQERRKSIRTDETNVEESIEVDLEQESIEEKSSNVSDVVIDSILYGKSLKQKN
jgi:hypothetical protein